MLSFGNDGDCCSLVLKYAWEQCSKHSGGIVQDTAGFALCEIGLMVFDKDLAQPSAFHTSGAGEPVDLIHRQYDLMGGIQRDDRLRQVCIKNDLCGMWVAVDIEFGVLCDIAESNTAAHCINAV